MGCHLPKHGADARQSSCLFWVLNTLNTDKCRYNWAITTVTRKEAPTPSRQYSMLMGNRLRSGHAPENFRLFTVGCGPKRAGSCNDDVKTRYNLSMRQEMMLYDVANDGNVWPQPHIGPQLRTVWKCATHGHLFALITMFGSDCTKNGLQYPTFQQHVPT